MVCIFGWITGRFAYLLVCLLATLFICWLVCWFFSLLRGLLAALFICCMVLVPFFVSCIYIFFCLLLCYSNWLACFADVVDSRFVFVFVLTSLGLVLSVCFLFIFCLN